MLRTASFISDDAPVQLERMITVASLQGLWRRSLIRRPGQPDDTTTSVYWLQGSEAYLDIRQPADKPDFSNAHELGDLTLEQCSWLARQEGFAGRLVTDGQYFEWIREIDFQPPSGQADAGSLHWEGEVLIERGRDVDYVEHWHRAPPPDTPYFTYVRNRAVPLKRAPLVEQVAAAKTLQQAQALIDCEISFGTNGLITASTLPFRINKPCFP